ncbi:MAG TPA: 16S rRNA (guanine(966)-N(2))-methyltransferase RsmD [Thermoanaerobaculia bacterium]|nr:16S rRNA (guanine(966)-N(2))-methyltransferase RsmD [Thermoanaerobaculia bacterium]
MKPGVRITGGLFKGRGLTVPPSARPTEGRVREALFSMWNDQLENARILDLFAGSGVVGLEAVGRGALRALFVDQDLRAIQMLEANVEKLGPEARGLVEIRRLSLPAGLARLARDGAGPFDLIFADPPYAFGAYEDLLAGMMPLLTSEEGEVVIEHSSRRDLPVQVGKLVRVDDRSYGESSLAFYRQGPE